MEASREAILQRVQLNVLDELSYSERQSTNLHIDRRVIAEGESIGPEHLKIKAKQASVLVWADDVPRANFGHDCRYLLFSAESGELAQTVYAQLPPYGAKPPESLVAFHQPVQFLPNPITIPLRPILRCPVIWERQRYAILWSGMSNKRHLNDMEFLYRTLIDRYGFDRDHIYAHSYDGTLDTQDGVQTTWPGDSTAYRINVTGSGDRAGFESAIDDLKSRIDADDLLLIHTNNHGSYGGTPGSAAWCTYPNWGSYAAPDFASKIGELPRFDKLICMFEPCHAGGFNAPVLASSPANSTSVASAAIEPNNSYVSADGNWDPFARDWIAAQAGHDAFGGTLAFDPDGDHDGIIEAEEAFWYADVIKDPLDTPNFSESSEPAGDIALGRQYVIWWWWCWILRAELEKYHVRLPIPEYYELLRKAQPELVKLSRELDRHSSELRKEFEPRLKAVVEEAFGGR
ncbi:MAG: hypothetical protein M3022_04010 [Actinomycetota bacterium]|nr:hypothetical protein [Actinomycetota bacterium]